MRMSLSTSQPSRMRGTVLLLLLPMLMVATLCASTIAAPVTLKFEAAIGPPRQGGSGDFELPFSFAEGDAISGEFTFEPLDAPPNVKETFVIQPFSLKFIIDGFSLSVLNYSLRVEDDFFGADIPAPMDVIRLNDKWNEMDGSEGTEFTSNFAFFGEEDLLIGADIPGDSATWSSFDYQNNSSILVSFRRLSGWQYEYRGFKTFITSVNLVPEPTANCLLLAALTISGLVALCKFHGGKSCLIGSAVKIGPRETHAIVD